MSEIKLTIAAAGRETDITRLTQSLTWAGAYNQVGRTLDFSLAVSEIDQRLPKVDCPLGANIRLFAEGKTLFDGFVFSRRRNTEADLLTIGCCDRGIYLKRNQTAIKVVNQTPEDIAARICGDFGIQAGSLAATGVKISRNFPGVDLYSVIQTAYTKASEQNGKRYMIRFSGEKLEVIEKKQGESARVLRAGSNLISLSVTESVENLVNQVVIYDKNDALVKVQKNDELIGLYGLMQAYLRKEAGKDSDSQAARLLEDSGPSQKLSVKNLGNTAFIAGESVVLKEPVTGQYGLFWIDSDQHTWNGGLYRNQLTLNFRNLMDEREAGGKI